MSFYRRFLQDGRLYAVLSAAGFSLKAVFVKLAYAIADVAMHKNMARVILQ